MDTTYENETTLLLKNNIFQTLPEELLFQICECLSLLEKIKLSITSKYLFRLLYTNKIKMSNKTAKTFINGFNTLINTPKYYHNPSLTKSFLFTPLTTLITDVLVRKIVYYVTHKQYKHMEHYKNVSISELATEYSSLVNIPEKDKCLNESWRIFWDVLYTHVFADKPYKTMQHPLQNIESSILYSTVMFIYH